MSTPEQPATPPLTRKQMREIRNTGSTPVITGTPSADDAPTPTTTPPAPSAPVTGAPFPRPAEPPVVPPPPVADSAVDLGVSPLTRRQARQQEKIRTASVPVITPEVVAAHAAATGSAPSFAPPVAPVPAPQPQRSPFSTPEEPSAPESTESGMHDLFGLPRTQSEQTEEREEVDSSIWARPVQPAPQREAPAAEVRPVEAPGADTVDEAEDAAIRDVFSGTTPDEDERDAPKAVVSPLLGAGLLGKEATSSAPVAAPELPASFDQLLSRSTGAISVPNALIVSQAPEVSQLVGPVTATGEVLVTGTFNLPEGLGSTGHAKGTADGKEIDATLVDGELPSHSSPTPIAASAAVSTVKMPGEVIKPPTPEKGNRLMMSLAITAGVLAIALVGVLILAFATGAL
ncbi:hypothetical protein [Microbacterium sp. CPCC 204701]|uniref:hypothetical protein n=1 Tax=Microbacterium sp. CPCC 204701 TaxID=2493084 RepID=UPI001F0BFFF0|nr:hypothetical protein [Microbacterium sp. CPCC 204701]